MAAHANEASTVFSARLERTRESPSLSNQDDSMSTDWASASPARTSPNIDGTVSANRKAQHTQPSSAATDTILVAFHKEFWKRFPQTAAFYERMDNLTPCTHEPASPQIVPSGSVSHSDAEVTTDTPAKGSAKLERESPRYDRAGKLRPANKRFLTRDVFTGKLETPEHGKEDYSQLDEVQDWIKEKRYIKFDLIPQPFEFTFDDMDPEFITEPNHCKNQGRRLLVGKRRATEIWAVMPKNEKLYMPRLIKRDGADMPFTLVTKSKSEDQSNDPMPELDYPSEAFMHINEQFKADWTALNAVIAYVFLLCGEAVIVYSDSSKWPGQLSTAMTRMKKIYAPNDVHPTAATVDKTINAAKMALDEDDASTANVSNLTQLEVINEVLQKKGLLDQMKAMVSDSSIFTFKNLEVMVKAKNVHNVRDRAIFLGENEDVQTWAFVYRNPNKAQLSLVINIKKATGGQEVVQHFSDVPWTLTFPFEAFKQKSDLISFRKMQYVISYIFLACGEADKALNLTDALFKHFTNITKMVKRKYGSYAPPEDLTGVLKPSTSPDVGLQVGDKDTASTTASPNFDNSKLRVTLKAGKGATATLNKQNAASRIVPREKSGAQRTSMTPNNATPARSGTVRTLLQSIYSPDTPQLPPPRRVGELFTPRPISVLKDRPAAGHANRHSTYTAPAGVYRGLNNLHVSLFLEEALNENGKRPVDDEENIVAKYMRIDFKRTEATKLRVHQEGVTERAKRVMEDAQRVYEEEKRKMQLLQDCELELAGQQGEVSAEMTDQDITELPRRRGA